MFPSTSNRISNFREMARRRRQGGAGDAEALRHVRALTRAAGSSFYWAMRILRRERRDAMFAIYAFCREVDDIADGEAPAAEKLAQLDAWRAEIHRLYDGTPGRVTARALIAPTRRYALERKDFLAVIDGMEMDARGFAAGPAMAELEAYCDRVAGAVGLLSIRAFGAAGPRGRDFALSLGGALQLTNILRDLKQDAALGRLYVPAELLDRHGIDERDPDMVLVSTALPAVCDELAAVARRRYGDAARALEDCPRRPLRPAVVMMMHYRRILDRLVQRGWTDLDREVGLSGWEKLWIAGRYGLL